MEQGAVAPQSGAAGTGGNATPRTPSAMLPWLACVVSIGVYQLGITLLNTAVFPLFSGIFLEARDVGSLFSAVLGLALYGLVSTRPMLCRPKLWMLVSLIAYLAGILGMIGGVQLGLSLIHI